MYLTKQNDMMTHYLGDCSPSRELDTEFAMIKGATKFLSIENKYLGMWVNE
jgi:hypothetical protein